MSNALQPPPPAQAQPRAPRTRRPRRQTSLWSEGEPFVWLSGGAMAIALAMIAALLGFVLLQGFATFWPQPMVAIETLAGAQLLGEVRASERYRPQAQAFEVLPPGLRAEAAARVAAAGGECERRLVRIENFELTGEHYRWISDFEVARESRPEWAVLVERRSGGRLQGLPRALELDGQALEREPAAILERLQRDLGPAHARVEERLRIERDEIGDVNAELEHDRLALRRVELARGRASPEFEAEARRVEQRAGQLEREHERIGERIRALDAENAREVLLVEAPGGSEVRVRLADIVRAHAPNRLGLAGELGIYFSRWGEFLGADPRESNSEGGVFPAIFGTVLMTLVMTLLVVPFGVMAALYLREYARPGLLVDLVRIAVNNLAGVPSIVFGVFGFGFFCLAIGSSLDQLLFAERLPNPTFGKGGVLWASLTLALLTLPVVIVATEEALSAVPRSMREGSFACGATKWQTIRRIVLPRALPGILTGAILAVARGAGEVAPLMLVGAVKIAPELPVDARFPFVHPERSFLHLGFHIYDLGFQSQNSEAAKPMVYTTTLLLIGIVVLLNVTAIWVRARLRRRFATTHI